MELMREMLQNILEDKEVSQAYKDEIEDFVAINTDENDFLAEAYELAQELLYINPGEKLPLSVSRFVEWKFEDEMENGNGSAACALGIMYLQGRCVKCDYEKALECFEKAESLSTFISASKAIFLVLTIDNSSLYSASSAVGS